MNPKPFWESMTFWAVAIFIGLVVWQGSKGTLEIEQIAGIAEKVALALAALGLRKANGGLTLK